MIDLSRRGLFGFLSGLGGAALISGKVSPADAVSLVEKAPVKATIPTEVAHAVGGARFEAMCKALERDVSQDVFDAWFRALDFERYDGTTLTVSVPVKFLKKWLDAHYVDELLRSARSAYHPIERVEIIVRPPRYTEGVALT